jgi:hypothetical protein
MLLQAHALSILKSFSHRIDFLTPAQSYQLITPHAKTERRSGAWADLFPEFPEEPKTAIEIP